MLTPCLILSNDRTEAEVRAERDRLDALAAQMFPREWQRANAKPTHQSKARRALRDRVTHCLKMRELHDAGACCGNCRDFKKRPGPGHKGEFICAAGSDFHGDQIAKPDGLCTGHAFKSKNLNSGRNTGSDASPGEPANNPQPATPALGGANSHGGST